MVKIKILRSAVGSLVSLGLIKELQKHGIEVVGMDINHNNYNRIYLGKCYMVPPPDSKQFISTILDILSKEQPDALLPGPDHEIYELALYKEQIEEHKTVLLCPDYQSVDVCVDKVKTYQYFERENIPYPKTYQLNNVNNLPFPLFMKPRFGSGSKHAYKIRDETELYYRMKKHTNSNSIYQEYIFGTEYSVDILADKQGDMICCVPRKRIKTSNGLSIISQTEYKPKIIEYCAQIVKDLQLFGPSCIQCFETRDGLKFLEINNRFGGGAVLSIKACPGFIPSLKKLITGQKITQDRPFVFDEKLTMYRNYTEAYESYSDKI